ncbi:MAG: hypothetical protein JOZ69_23095, partial [Myxococcales bacterium]|nr:hypothetical protein [Myxococcales bacterium]
MKTYRDGGPRGRGGAGLRGRRAGRAGRIGLSLAVVLSTVRASADDTHTGAPPPDAKELVEAPKPVA